MNDNWLWLTPWKQIDIWIFLLQLETRWPPNFQLGRMIKQLDYLIAQMIFSEGSCVKFQLIQGKSRYLNYFSMGSYQPCDLDSMTDRTRNNNCDLFQIYRDSDKSDWKCPRERCEICLCNFPWLGHFLFKLKRCSSSEKEIGTGDFF